MEKKTARFTLLIDPEKKRRFEKICAEQDMTPSQVIRKLIREYIQAHERDPGPPSALPPGAA